MRQSWSSLLFLHWALPAEAIAPLLPDGLEVDTFDGRSYVGLVPFAMAGVRPEGCPAVPWLSNFLEVNVRTYVHHRGSGPGVWFFSLDAANPVAVALARSLWHLPYHRATMRLDRDGESGAISYESRRLGRPKGVGCSVGYRPIGSPREAEPGSLEHFLVERYLMYVSAGGQLRVGQVHHRPYPVQGAELIHLQEDLVAASGISLPDAAPLAHFASGVTVEIFPLEPVGQSSRPSVLPSPT
ncbi:DUF2071 domain-containing protein [Tautonia sociabilis]|uniref:DUF2071 domain-containing protein n=2 Tax=Tautonia sociabilis TaxID=2080755 RepID=A0A432MQT0_9BACT|nr:DUF2071 domain-containing protein [Tautonia sociabilis]